MSSLSAACIIFTLIVSLLLPQLLIRIPILNTLAAKEGFLAFTQAHPVLYALGLAVTVHSIQILKNIRCRWAAEEAQEVPYDSQA